MAVCYIGIGSNLGDREKNIRLALERINRLKDTKVMEVSKIIETKPVGGPAGGGKFLNACLKMRTNFSALSLLKKLKTIEKELGRAKGRIRYSPRPIDLDILFYDNKVINRKDLKVPHPKIFEREFVIKPLWDII